MDKTKEAILAQMGFDAKRRELIERHEQMLKPKPLQKWNPKK